MGEYTNQMLALLPLIVATSVFMIMGIVNYKKRIVRYEIYKGIFGPIKSLLFVTFCLMGPGLIVTLIIGLILGVNINIINYLIRGVGAILLAILLGWHTAKKAGSKDAVSEMFFA